MNRKQKINGKINKERKQMGSGLEIYSWVTKDLLKKRRLHPE
jgi:hypothetical protein